MNQVVKFSEPFEIFANWFDKAKKNQSIIEPTAMCLSTVDQNHCPSSRMVLLKKFDESGFCFFTNLTSRKSKELEQNKNVALCFYWGALGLQVRIEGLVEKVSEKEADDYFSSRRRESQIGAWASKQSRELESWEHFQNTIKEVENDFANQIVSRPPFWSGFRVVPKAIEFWQEGEFRIHQRSLYTKFENGWKLTKLYP